MQLLGKIEKADGLFNSTDPIEFTPVDPNAYWYSINQGKMVQMNAPNVNNDNQRYYPIMTSYVGSDNYRVFHYDDATNDWVSGYPTITTTKGIKIVVKPQTDVKMINVYIVAKSSDYDRIPDLSATARVETYIASDITAANFTDYRFWDHHGSVTGDRLIPLAICLANQQVSNSRKTLGGVCATVINDQLKLMWDASLYQVETNTASQWGKLVQISSTYYSASAAPTPIDSLDVRLTKLENEMSGLSNKMDNLISSVSQLESRVNKVLTQVSTVFVSR